MTSPTPVFLRHGWATAFLGALALRLAACDPSEPPGFPVDNSSPRVFLIGNSLTWDTVPSRLDSPAQWHIACGRSLPWILANPDPSCVDDATPWPDALSETRYDVLVVQPHYGSTLDENVDAITTWMAMQPDARVVIHTGWARANAIAAEYGSDVADGDMVHTPTWVGSLVAQLRERHPGRELRETRAMDLIARADADAARGRTPFDSVAVLYRDVQHMSYGAGRYLMHNAMRAALGEEPSAAGFRLPPDDKRYLDSLLASAIGAGPVAH